MWSGTGRGRVAAPPFYAVQLLLSLPLRVVHEGPGEVKADLHAIGGGGVSAMRAQVCEPMRVQCYEGSGL